MKTTLALSTAVAAALGLAGNAQAAISAVQSSLSQTVMLSFTNSTVDAVQWNDFYFTCNTSDFAAGTEVRFCDSSGNLHRSSPRSPPGSDSISGDEVWTFQGDSLSLSPFLSANGSPPTPGVDPTYTGDYPGTSADPDGGVAMDDGGLLFGIPFSFLAPIVGSDAAAAYGVGHFHATSATTFELLFPVLEMQWNGIYFPLGQASGGITFFGTHDGTSFSMWAEEWIDGGEDPIGMGFEGWAVQWYYVGDISFGWVVDPVPVPAATWLLGSGLVGLTAAARRRKAA